MLKDIKKMIDVIIENRKKRIEEHKRKTKMLKSLTYKQLRKLALDYGIKIDKQDKVLDEKALTFKYIKKDKSYRELIEEIANMFDEDELKRILEKTK